MFAWLYGRELGWRGALQSWGREFRENRHFRLLFFLVLYTAMILCKTLLCRPVWDDIFRDVIGVWGIRNRKGELYTENIENVFLFVPFTFLLLAVYGEKLRGKYGASAFSFLRFSAAVSLGLSVGIEALQLMLRLGAIQLSDVVFNTLGGLAGCVLYGLVHRIRSSKKR